MNVKSSKVKEEKEFSNVTEDEKFKILDVGTRLKCLKSSKDGDTWRALTACGNNIV
jgi:hypothetical protein